MISGVTIPPSVEYVNNLNGAAPAWAHCGPYETNEEALPVFYSHNCCYNVHVETDLSRWGHYKNLHPLLRCPT